MNKNLLLSVVLTVTMLNYQPEAFAEIIAGSDNCSKTTQLSQNYSYTTSGHNCSWSVSDDGVLTITGTGSGATVGDHGYGTPWSGYAVKTVVLDNISTNGTYSLFGCWQAETILLINGASNSSSSSYFTPKAQTVNCNNGDADSCLYDLGIKCGRFAEKTNGECKPKIRYTLPEADALTSNDNENRIEWIFE